MRRFVLSAEAQADIDDIAAHIAEAASPRVARHVMADVREAVALLVSRPFAGHVREDLTKADVRFWCIYSYLIVYRPSTKPLQIVRVVHGHRDLEALFRDLV